MIRRYIDWSLLAGEADKKMVIDMVNRQKEALISVATGGPLIKDVNPDYKQEYIKVKHLLSKLGLEYPNEFSDLWLWRDFWK